MKRLVYATLFVFCAISFVLLDSCKKESQQSDEWQLVWEENFDNGDTFDTAVWSKIPRGRVDWNNYMSDCDSLYQVRDGKMVVRGIANTCPDDSVPYITGGIFTKDKKAFGNGRLEISAKFNDVKGAWPAIWLMPFDRGNEAWPICGEIDIMERLSYDTIAYQTVHSNYTVNHDLTENPKSSQTAPIDKTGFNVYGVELYPDSVVFFVNGVKNFTYPRIETDIEGQFPFDKDWYLMLDMQLGGKWVGEVEPADLPAEMEIDWVKFYQK